MVLKLVFKNLASVVPGVCLTRKQQELRDEYTSSLDPLQYLDVAEREAYDQWTDLEAQAMTSARLRSFQVKPSETSIPLGLAL